MVTDIIFEVYVFIANKYNYMKNNSFDLSILRIFLDELLCLVLFVISKQLSMHWFLNLFLFLLTFLVLWRHMYMRPARAIGIDYGRIYICVRQKLPA